MWILFFSLWILCQHKGLKAQGVLPSGSGHGDVQAGGILHKESMEMDNSSSSSEINKTKQSVVLLFLQCWEHPGPWGQTLIAQ